MLLTREHGRLEARDLLRAIEGPAVAVSGLVGDGSGTAERMQYVHLLRRAAYGEDPVGP